HAGNRGLADELVELADLWVFVTTGSRYGDAVPWSRLHSAHERGVSLAVVLNRVDPDALRTVRRDLVEPLDGQGLASVPCFVSPASGSQCWAPRASRAALSPAPCAAPGPPCGKRCSRSPPPWRTSGETTSRCRTPSRPPPRTLLLRWPRTSPRAGPPSAPPPPHGWPTPAPEECWHPWWQPPPTWWNRGGSAARPPRGVPPSEGCVRCAS